MALPAVAATTFDVLLALRGLPDVETGEAAHGLNIHIDDQDVTTEYVTQLRRLLRDAPDAAVEQGYRAGVETWWQLAQRHGGGRFSARVVNAALARNAAQIEALFESLGEASDDCLGNLHPFNYCYSHIPLAPVSVRALLGIETGLARNTKLRIGYTTGEQAVGGIEATCTLMVETSLTEIEKRLAEIETLVEEVYGLVTVNGPLYRKVGLLATAVEGLRRQVDDCTTSIGAPAQISVINDTLLQIKKLLNIKD